MRSRSSPRLGGKGRRGEERRGKGREAKCGLWRLMGWARASVSPRHAVATRARIAITRGRAIHGGGEDAKAKAQVVFVCVELLQSQAAVCSGLRALDDLCRRAEGVAKLSPCLLPTPACRRAVDFSGNRIRCARRFTHVAGKWTKWYGIFGTRLQFFFHF